MKKTRVLIVDDSATMRSLIAACLDDPEIEVVGFANDPLEARAAIKALNPDVITLDVEMPNMNGLDFLERLMRLRPMPVVMVSSLTQSGAEATVEALELGAVDCVGKPETVDEARLAFSALPQIVKAAASSRVRPPETPTRKQAPPTYPDTDQIVALGASTGGVDALLRILETFPANAPATVIVQHMPAAFTPSFAARLNRACAAQVSEATDGAPLRQGQIYLAPGGEAHLTLTPGPAPRCRLVRADPVNGHRPSVDFLFRSVAALQRPSIGVILTGMGRDGAEGLKAMRDVGARTLGQDEASSIVYGMPRVAMEIGAVERQLPLSKIGAAILDACAPTSATRVA